MRSRLAAILSLVVLLGCERAGPLYTPNQPAPVVYANPMLINIPDHKVVWDGIHDVVSQYFPIEHEEPVRNVGGTFIGGRMVGGTFIDGRLDTFHIPGATMLEPWRHDSADSYQRLESTLQSIRRYAVVKVVVHPTENGGYGFWVDVAVYKELENVRRPEHATAGSATFRNDVSPSRSVTPDLSAGPNQNWIPQGRDTAAEQRILGQILDRFTPAGTPVPVNQLLLW
jgi:hypothetical protein